MMLNNSWLAGSVIGLVMGRRAVMRGVAYAHWQCVHMRAKEGVCVFRVCVHVGVVCMLVNVFECCGTCLRSVVSCVSQDHIEPSKFVPPSRPMRLTV